VNFSHLFIFLFFFTFCILGFYIFPSAVLLCYGSRFDGLVPLNKYDDDDDDDDGWTEGHRVTAKTALTHCTAR